MKNENDKIKIKMNELERNKTSFCLRFVINKNEKKRNRKMRSRNTEHRKEIINKYGQLDNQMHSNSAVL